VDAKTWRMTSPSTAPAETAAVTALLGSLRAARALSFPADGAGARKALGLEAPAVDLLLAGPGGEVRIRLAETRVEGVRRAHALREAGGEALLAEVPPSALSELTRGPSDLRSRAVLSFRKEDVARLAFSPGGSKVAVVVERVRGEGGAEDAWRVISPVAGAAKKFKLSSVLWMLESLKAAAPSPEKLDARKQGLGEAARSFTLSDAAGKPLASLRLGKEIPGKPGMLYAKGSREELLEVDAVRVADLPASSADVLEPSDAGLP
jgi:hypothetical protein